jgi:DNA-binding GntR family transcriptional regulator
VKLLVARTSLVVALYENRQGLACWHDDHGEMVALIQARRHRAAVALMRRHLDEIEGGLVLDGVAAGTLDVRIMLAANQG